MWKLIKYLFVSFSIFYFFGSCTPEVRYSSNDTYIYNSNNKTDAINTELTTHQKISEILKSKKYSNLDNRRKQILLLASKWIGTPYCYGGTTSRCIDCSGFTQQVFNSAGIKIPRTAKQQYQFGNTVNKNRILPGDLVFFIRHHKIGHVGIYIGNNEFIHAATSKGVTKQSQTDSYYKRTFAGYKRIL